MKTLLCNACGGTLEEIDRSTFICTYCGTKHIVSDDEDTVKPEHRMTSASDRYSAALYAMSTAKSEDDYLAAARLFEGIRGYRDSERLYDECINKATVTRNDELYAQAVRLMSEGTPHFLLEAAKIFKQIQGWRDSESLLKECRTEAERMQKECSEHNKVVKRRQEKERQRKTVVISIAITAALVLYVLLAVLYSGAL